MTADGPVTNYGEGKEKDVTKKEMDEVARKWAEKRKGKTFVGKNLSASDLLGENAQNVNITKS